MEADGKGPKSLKYTSSRTYTIHLDRYSQPIFLSTTYSTKVTVNIHSSSLLAFLAETTGGGCTFRITLLYLLIGGVPLPVTSKIT
jgi:hypothetical protein